MKIYLFALLFFGPALLHAQTVFNTSGNESTAGDYAFAFSIGEPLTETVTAGNYRLSQGFIQPETGGWVETIEVQGIDWTVRLFPNPVAELLTLKAEQAAMISMRLFVYASNGQLVLTDRMEAGECEHQFQFRHFSDGAYRLVLLSEMGTLIKTFSIIKTGN